MSCCSSLIYLPLVLTCELSPWTQRHLVSPVRHRSCLSTSAFTTSHCVEKLSKHQRAATVALPAASTGWASRGSFGRGGASCVCARIWPDVLLFSFLQTAANVPINKLQLQMLDLRRVSLDPNKHWITISESLYPPDLLLSTVSKDYCSFRPHNDYISAQTDFRNPPWRVSREDPLSSLTVWQLIRPLHITLFESFWL